jgi:hypothetical protein
MTYIHSPPVIEIQQGATGWEQKRAIINNSLEMINKSDKLIFHKYHLF